MNVASLAGFGIVFLLVAWGLSSVGGLVLLVGRKSLRACGPMVERRVAAAVAIVPVVGAVAVVAALITKSIAGPDHCTIHAHHAHLCLVHGAIWLDRAWIMVALASTGALVVMRAALLVTGLVRGHRAIRQLHGVSASRDDVQVVESDRVFCFVAGLLRPAIYVSSRAWSTLSAEHRAALVAHEAAHLRHGDLGHRVLVEALLVLAAPLTAGVVRAAWLSASERLCDADAVQSTGDAVSVAGAMVAMCRLVTQQPAALLGFTPHAHELAERVRCVLDGVPTGARAASTLTRRLVLAMVAFVIATACGAAPLHHALETLLG